MGQIIFAFHFIQQEEHIMRTSKFTKALTIALPPEHFEQIKLITDDLCISMAAWVRDAVAAALTKNQEQEDIKNDE
jgi:hypothetical protein